MTHAELCTLMDKAGEHESIKLQLADRDEMTVYLKVAALQREVETLRAERDRFREALQFIEQMKFCRVIPNGAMADLHRFACPHCTARLALAEAPKETR